MNSITHQHRSRVSRECEQGEDGLPVDVVLVFSGHRESVACAPSNITPNTHIRPSGGAGVAASHTGHLLEFTQRHDTSTQPPWRRLTAQDKKKMAEKQNTYYYLISLQFTLRLDILLSGAVRMCDNRNGRGAAWSEAKKWTNWTNEQRVHVSECLECCISY